MTILEERRRKRMGHIKDIANLADVSISTVSRVLNQDASLSAMEWFATEFDCC